FPNGTVCPGCGSSNIVDDDLYCQAQLVCVDCGTVVSEGTLADDPVGGTGRNRTLRLERVKEMCRILRLNSEIEDLALTYFRQAYQQESFINVTLQRKEVLVGCCVYVSCRQRNWPITLGTISSLLDADQTLVGGVYQEMIKILNIQAPFVNIADVIGSSMKLAEDSKVLTKRAVALVELAGDSWIVTGRRPLPIMMAATYLAWQSLNPNKHRLRLSLDKFCHLAKVQKRNPAVTRITELKEVLCKLGRELPWVRETVTQDDVVRLVGDILEHRHTLLTRANDSHQTEDLEPNWGKRVLFAPPCVIHAKRRREEPPVLNVTGDEEISDSEIDSYIRTPQEARDFALMQKAVSSSDSGNS
uniref:Transcription factor IIIB 50 kDa subunit n=1 Tax=Xiphophorus couchianus TaxID=32473 RepID=A0A3B5L0H8_9TELE